MPRVVPSQVVEMMDQLILSRYQGNVGVVPGYSWVALSGQCLRKQIHESKGESEANFSARPFALGN